MVELVEILETKKEGDSDLYFFIVEYKGNRYKVLYKDIWVGDNSKGCICEGIWDNDGNEIYNLFDKKNNGRVSIEFDDGIEELFWDSVYGN